MITIRFSPIESLPDAVLKPQGPAATAFLDRGVTTFHQAAYYVKNLPYGYNGSSDNAMILFDDGFGTCLTKHGLVARLAQELGLSIRRCEGFYPLTDHIVNGVDEILAGYGLPYIPRTHCFLSDKKSYVDLTEGNCTGKKGMIENYLAIFQVEPEQTEAEVDGFYRRQYSAICAENPVFARIGVEGMLEVLRRCQERNVALCQVR